MRSECQPRLGWHHLLSNLILLEVYQLKSLSAYSALTQPRIRNCRPLRTHPRSRRNRCPDQAVSEAKAASSRYCHPSIYLKYQGSKRVYHNDEQIENESHGASPRYCTAISLQSDRSCAVSCENGLIGGLIHPKSLNRSRLSWAHEDGCNWSAPVSWLAAS